MATLKANGEVLVKMSCSRISRDNAEGDEMTRETVITYLFMSSGWTLKKTDSRLDFGLGDGPKYYPGTWKRHKRIKSGLIEDKKALFEAVQQWADGLRAKGWDAEIA